MATNAVPDENAVLIARFLENYLDGVQNLPDDIQRNYTQMRERDHKYLEILRDLDQLWDHLSRKDIDTSVRRRGIGQVHRALIKAQSTGDEKLQLWQNVQDLTENKARQLDMEYKGLDMGRENDLNADNHKPEAQPERASKRSRRQRHVDVALRYDASHDKPEKELPPPTSCKKQKKKKRKTKAEKEQVESPFEPPIDPDEPTYCLCEQVSFGEMICCDNTNCEREWFHFSCVGLVVKPKGKWYCPNCRGDRSNQMRQPSS